MMIITAKKGRGTKMHLFIDDEYDFTVTADFWYSSSFQSGDEIDESELKQLKRKAEDRKAFNKALNIICRRDHGERELAEKLSKTLSKESAEAAVEKAVGLGLVNDQTFAQKYAQELYSRKGFAPARIRLELLRKGISRNLADEVADGIEFNPQERIAELLDSKRFARQLTDDKGRERTCNTLARLGYSYSDIRSAMREIEIKISDDENEEPSLEFG